MKTGNRLVQIGAVTMMNLRNIPQRLSSSVVAIIGVAGVVTVFVAVLSISEGFRAALDLSGQDDVAIVLRGASDDEMTSSLSQDQTRIIADAPGVARSGSGPLVSPELYAVVDVPLRGTGTDANVPLRGVGEHGDDLRKHFRMVSGRNFTPGTFEVIAGRGASMQFAGLEVGKTVRWDSTNWTVVGIFEDQGSVAESEVWTDAAVLQGAYQRGTSFQSVRAKLTSASALQTFKDALTSDPRLNVQVVTEKQFYEEQSRVLRTLIGTVGTAIALLMGIGAVFGALLTMYTAVLNRTREIATLRAIGFSAGPVVISVLSEALILGLLGGVVGSLIAYFGFNGLRASTMNFSTFSQITFAFTVTVPLVVQGLVYAVLLGLVGGLLPSWRAARLPIVAGLREL